MESPYLSVIIPAYNEEQRITSTLDKLVTYLDGRPDSWEVLVIDDGSDDSTAAVARQRARELEAPISVESIPHAGKGWAVKRGMLAASGEYRFMCDADLAMPIEQLNSFLERMADGYDIVIGSREMPGAGRIGEPMGRHIRGRVFNRAVRLVAVGGFDDTQCGFKCFKGDVAAELFEMQRTRGFGFDVEILHFAVKQGLRVLEMPIEWHHQEQSKVRPVTDSLLMLRDTFMVRLRGLPQERDR